MAEITKLKPGRKGVLCPICGKVRDQRYRPFCSKRCADIDLARWLGGDYRIATEEKPEEVTPSERAPEEK
jgi:uncharacterized protein